MTKRFYIDDFVEDLNHRSVILYVGEDIDTVHLRDNLRKDNCGHLYRFEYMMDENTAYEMRRFFYIANCDFQDLDYPVYEYIIEYDYNVYNLKFADGRYFFDVDL